MKHSFCLGTLILAISLSPFAQQPIAPQNEIKSQAAALDQRIKGLEYNIENHKKSIKKQETIVESILALNTSATIELNFYNDEITRIQNEYDEESKKDPRLIYKSPQYDGSYYSQRLNRYLKEVNESFKQRDQAQAMITKNYQQFVAPEEKALNQLNEELKQLQVNLNEKTLQKRELFLNTYKQYQPSVIQSLSLSLPSHVNIFNYPLYTAEWQMKPLDVATELEAYISKIEQLDILIKKAEERREKAAKELQLAHLSWTGMNQKYIAEMESDLYWATLLEYLDVAIAVGSAGAALPAALIFEAVWRGSGIIYDLGTNNQQFSTFPDLPERFLEIRDQLSKFGPGSGLDDKLKEHLKEIRLRSFTNSNATETSTPNSIELRILQQQGFTSLHTIYDKSLWDLSKDEANEFVKGLFGKFTEAGFNIYDLNKRFELMQKMGSFLSEIDKAFSLPIEDLNKSYMGKIVQTVEEHRIKADFGKSFLVTAAKYGIQNFRSNRIDTYFALARLELQWFAKRYELYESRVSLQLLQAIKDNAILWLGNSLKELRPRAELIGASTEASANLIILGDDEINENIVLQTTLSKPMDNIRYRVVADKLEKEFSAIGKDAITGNKIFLYLPKKAFAVNDSGLFYVQFTSPDQQTLFDADPTTVAILKDNLEWDGIETGMNTYPIKVVRAMVRPEFKEVSPRSSFRVSIIAPFSDNKRGRGNIYLRIYSIADKNILVEKHYVSSSGDGKPILQEILAPSLPGSYLLQLYNEDRKQVLATHTLQVKEYIDAATDPAGKFCSQRLTEFFKIGIQWSEFLYFFPSYTFDGNESKIFQSLKLLDDIENSEMLRSFLKLPFRKSFFESIKKIKELPFAEKRKEVDKLYGELGRNIIESEISCDLGISGSAIFYAGKGLGDIYASCKDYINNKMNIPNESKDYMLRMIRELKLTLEPLRKCLPDMDLSVLNMKSIPDDPAALLKLLKEKLIIDFTTSNCCCKSDLYKPYDDVSLNGNAKKLNSYNVFPILLTDDYWQSSSVFINKPLYFTSTTNLSGSFSFEIDNPRGDGNGADGICFVLQSQSADAVVKGETGGGIGYGGIKPSVAVEFDTYKNNVDMDDNHIGVDVDGDLKSVLAVPAPDKLDDNKPWYSWVEYNSTTSLLEVWVSGYPAKPASPVLQTAINLYTHFKGHPVYIGFTSGTGAGAGDHMILNWNFDF